jgi:C4-dicarboxylate transporter DctQ subunit
VKLIKAVSRALSWIEQSIVVILLGGMVLLAFSQVVLRNVFSTGFLWADPFLRHMVLWIGFLGASLATQQEKHINIDLITRFLSPRITNLARITTNAFAGTVCGFLAHAGWTFLQSEITSEGALLTIGHIEFQAWWFQIIIPAGFGLMSFRFFLRTFEHIIEVFHPAASVPPTTNVPTLDV